MNDNYKVHEKILAGKLLSSTAMSVSSRLDQFCSWLLVGVGGTYALVLANFDSLKELICLPSLKASLSLLLVAIVLGVVQRWLAAIVASGALAGEKSESLAKEAAEHEIDFQVVFREMQKGLFPPASWLTRRSFEKIIAGDFAASGRLSMCLSQLQSGIVVILVILITAALATTFNGIYV